jgi:hypothetical protein
MNKRTAEQGRDWAVSESSGSADGDLQIQRIDCPDDGSAPYFTGDDEAVRHVVNRARAGDEGAITALWEVLEHDTLVQRILWKG